MTLKKYFRGVAVVLFGLFATAIVLWIEGIAFVPQVRILAILGWFIAFAGLFVFMPWKMPFSRVLIFVWLGFGVFLRFGSLNIYWVVGVSVVTFVAWFLLESALDSFKTSLAYKD